jgi:nicotinamidase-related amidase
MNYCGGPRAVGALIIDVQEHYLQQLPLASQKRLLHENLRVVDLMAHAGLPVAYVEHDSFGPTHSELLERILELPASQRARFTKFGFDSFDDKRLTPWLRERGVQTLALCGQRVSVCMRQSAWSAPKKGFRPVLIEQASYDTKTYHWHPQADGACVETLDELF